MTFDLENPSPRPGDALRDLAGNLLTARYGRPVREKLIAGKRVDLLFEFKQFGRTRRLIVEAKDYDRNLQREDLVRIWADYEPVLREAKSAELLIVSRRGLASAAEEYVETRQEMAHQTIWELENEVLGLTDYIRGLADLFEEDGLSRYYVPGQARAVIYQADVRHVSEAEAPLFDALQAWMSSPDKRPVAVLGGYGAGKSSFARRLVSNQAKAALADPYQRRPVLIRLGDMARASSLEGLLGAKFTHEFPIDGFNVANFLGLNARGRLLIVLDGFDEMKHAMSWADFRSQIKTLNRLVEGQAKVVLLGRPAAFVSMDEHYHVLRGRKPHAEGYHRLPDWPEFLEFELQPFTPEDRSGFVSAYLAYLDTVSHSPRGEAAILARAAEVNRIADREPEIFSKPVHARIFTDLAADSSVDLAPFVDGVSRWVLYETFFISLADREAEKETRRRIPENERLRFLRELAWWLWTEQGGATAFHAEDIPETLFEGLDEGDATSTDAVRREYLTGAFLEKKSDDIYYFGHRSFAEYLVAQQLAEHQPEPADHAAYSRLITDGVREFLSEHPDPAVIQAWPSTLSSATGELHLDYLQFISAGVGGADALRARLTPSSPMELVVRALGPDLSIGRTEALEAALRDPRDAVFFPALYLRQIASIGSDTGQEEFDAVVAAALLDRVFTGAEYDPATGKAPVAMEYEDARKIAAQALPELRTELGDRRLLLNGQALARNMADHMSRGGFQIAPRRPYALRSALDSSSISWSEVLSRISEDNRTVVTAYFRQKSNLTGLFTRGYVQDRTRGKRRS